MEPFARKQTRSTMTHSVTEAGRFLYALPPCRMWPHSNIPQHAAALPKYNKGAGRMLGLKTSLPFTLEWVHRPRCDAGMGRRHTSLFYCRPAAKAPAGRERPLALISAYADRPSVSRGVAGEIIPAVHTSLLRPRAV